MFRRLLWGLMLAAFALLTSAAFAQDATASTAYLRILQLTNDGSSVSVTLENGQTVLSNFAPNSLSDYLTFPVNRSTVITLTITPTRGPSFRREWAVPPLSAEHYTAALVGSSADNTLELIFIAEDSLCAGKLASGSCVIFVNSLRGSPALTLSANSTSVVTDAGYRDVVVGSVPAGTYQDFTAVDPSNPQTQIFHLRLRVFEPNVIYLYLLRGTYPGAIPTNYTVGSIRRVPVDTMTFLRGLTASLQLTDTHTLYATENIVAILDQSGFAQLLATPQLPLTVFAPLDSALVQIAPALYQCVMSNPAALRALILNHIVVGSYTPAQLISAGHLTTMAGTTLTFQATTGGFLINNTVSVSNTLSYPTSTGQVDLIDTALLPPGFSNQYCTSG